MTDIENNAILIQGHIPNRIDPQGNLTPSQKKEIFEFSLKHLRQNNPDAYIVLTGHGDIKLDNETLADWAFWEGAYPIDDGGLVIGYPAQFKWLGIGIDHLKQKGFQKCLKTRLDSLILRPNIVEWCNEITQLEQKDFLITQMTGSPSFFGDCFVFGRTDTLLHTWHPNNSFVHPDGLIQTAHYFRSFFKEKQLDWKSFLKELCSFRDMNEIPFIDLRWNLHKIIAKFGDLQSVSRDNFMEYIWGITNGWHSVNNETLICNRREMWNKNQFYE